jgi:predicted MFS family arabinose efflux permease
MVMARYHLPARRSASAVGLLSLTVATGIGLGYPLTGLLAQSFDYHVAFWVGAGIVLFTFGLAIVVLPVDVDGPATHLDAVGAALFGVMLVSFLVALSEGAIWGWGSAQVIGLFVLALVIAPIWVWHERRIARPLVVLAQLRIPVVLAVNSAMLLICIVFYLFLPIIVEFEQIPRSSGFGFGASVVVAGLSLVPLSVGTALVGPIARWVRETLGARGTLITAQLLLGISVFFFAFEHRALWEAFVTMGICGIAVGLTFTMLPQFIVAAVPPNEIGTAMGLYQVVRTVGVTIGSAVSAVILAAYTPAHADLPSVDGFRTTLIVGGVISLAVIPVCFLLPSRMRAAATQT